MIMKLYLLTQSDNDGYDTYDSCIVCAKDEVDAKNITPTGEGVFRETTGFSFWAYNASAITCEEIGVANDSQERGVILSSFNAG